jgi:hypothetical protein
MIEIPQRRSQTVLFVLWGAVFLISLGSYFGLVVREEAKAKSARTMAEKLTQQTDKANAYIHAHSDLSDQKKKIEEMRTKIGESIPHGPVDITIGDYLERRASLFGINDVKWSIEGGIKPPSQEKDDADRLAIDPNSLKGSTFTVQFTARYKDVLRFIRSLSPEEGNASWPIEIITVDLRRNPGAKGYKVAVNLIARYLYR